MNQKYFYFINGKSDLSSFSINFSLYSNTSSINKLPSWFKSYELNSSSVVHPMLSKSQNSSSHLATSSQVSPSVPSLSQTLKASIVKSIRASSLSPLNKTLPLNNQEHP